LPAALFCLADANGNTTVTVEEQRGDGSTHTETRRLTAGEAQQQSNAQIGFSRGFGGGFGGFGNF